MNFSMVEIYRLVEYSIHDIPLVAFRCPAVEPRDAKYEAGIKSCKLDAKGRREMHYSIQLG